MNTSDITKGQIACIHAMVKKLNLTSSKGDIVLGFTDGRTDSVGDMYLDEAKAMIQWLKSQDPEEQSAERQRRYIISMAHECGYRKPGTTKVDMVKLDSWCVNYGYLHKKLNQYRQHELPKLVTQFEKVYKDYLNKV